MSHVHGKERSSVQRYLCNCMLDFSDAVMDDALVSRGMFELELEMYGVRSRERRGEDAPRVIGSLSYPPTPGC